MPKKTKPSVEEFLKEMELIDSEKYQLVATMRKLIFDQYPNIKERIMYGGILFTLEDDIAGLFAYAHHVSIEFGNGYLMQDPDKLLEGGGKYRRHLKIKSNEDITSKKVAFFLQQLEEIG